MRGDNNSFPLPLLQPRANTRSRDTRLALELRCHTLSAAFREATMTISRVRAFPLVQLEKTRLAIGALDLAQFGSLFG